MKRLLSVLLICSLAISLTGCADKTADNTIINDASEVQDATENSELKQTDETSDNAKVRTIDDIPEGSYVIEGKALTDEEIIEKYDLNNLSDSDLDMLINSLDPNDYVRSRIVTMRHLGQLTGPQTYWDSPMNEYTESYDYGAYLRDNYNFNPWDSDLNDFWALLAKARNQEERMSIATALNKYMQYNFDWENYFKENSSRKIYTAAELDEIKNSKDKIVEFSNCDYNTELSRMNQDQMMEIYNYAHDFYGSDIADKFIDRWTAVQCYNSLDDQFISYDPQTDAWSSYKDYYYVDLLEQNYYENNGGHNNRFGKYISLGIWANYYCHNGVAMADIKAGDKINNIIYTPDGKIGNIDRDVPDDKEYTKEEFYERIEALVFEDINVLRRSMGNFIDGTELKPFLGSDKWTNAYADQRAFERIIWYDASHTDMEHQRPKNTLNADGYSWTIPSFAALSNTITSTTSKRAWHADFWIEGYKKHDKGENCSHFIFVDKSNFKYNEYWAKQISDYAFWGLWSSDEHLLTMLSYDMNHCAIGVCEYENPQKYLKDACKDQILFHISQEFYSLDSEDAALDYRY